MMYRRKLFQELFECCKKLMTDRFRGYSKRAVQPVCEVQGANYAVQTSKMGSPKMSTFHLRGTKMSLINEKQCT
jgi:hypothetical protein